MPQGSSNAPRELRQVAAELAEKVKQLAFTEFEMFDLDGISFMLTAGPGAVEGGSNPQTFHRSATVNGYELAMPLSGSPYEKQRFVFLQALSALEQSRGVDAPSAHADSEDRARDYFG